MKYNIISWKDVGMANQGCPLFYKFYKFVKQYIASLFWGYTKGIQLHRDCITLYDTGHILMLEQVAVC